MATRRRGGPEDLSPEKEREIRDRLDAVIGDAVRELKAAGVKPGAIRTLLMGIVQRHA